MRALAVVAALSVACKSDKPAPSPAPAPAAPVTKVLVDGVPVASLTAAQVASWPRLDSLLPAEARRLGTWQRIDLSTAKGVVSVRQPSSSYPDMVPAVFPGTHGTPAFGIFDPVELAKHGKREVDVDSLIEVSITLAKGGGRGENEHGGGESAADPTQLRLAVAAGGTEKTLTGEALLTMPREPVPGSTEDEGKGWKLSSVLALAGVTRYQRLLLTDAKGTNLTLEAQDLDEKTAVPFVKLNRQGALRFRVFRKQGDTWQPGSDLRGLVRVQVVN